MLLGWRTVGPRPRIRPHAWPRRSTGSMAAAAWSTWPSDSAGPRRPFGSGRRGCARCSSRRTSITPTAPVRGRRMLPGAQSGRASHSSTACCRRSRNPPTLLLEMAHRPVTGRGRRGVSGWSRSRSRRLRPPGAAASGAASHPPRGRPDQRPAAHHRLAGVEHSGPLAHERRQGARPDDGARLWAVAGHARQQRAARCALWPGRDESSRRASARESSGRRRTSGPWSKWPGRGCRSTRACPSR